MAIIVLAIDRDTIARDAPLPRIDLSIPGNAGTQYNVVVLARLLDENLAPRAHRLGVTYTIGVHSDGQIQNTREVEASPNGIVRLVFNPTVRQYLAGLNPPIRWGIRATLGDQWRDLIDTNSVITMYDGRNDDPPVDAT